MEAAAAAPEGAAPGEPSGGAVAGRKRALEEVDGAGDGGAAAEGASSSSSSEEREADASSDEEDAEEEEEAPAGASKGRDLKRSRFIDDIADVDDEEEEEEEEAEDGLIENDLGEDLDAAAAVPRMRAAMNDTDMDKDEDLERFVKERYANAGAKYRGGEELDIQEATTVEQGALLPTNRDPKLWMVKCRPGKERELVICLMQKYLNLKKAGTPLRIKSVFYQEHLKGWIYVEAFSGPAAKEATSGMRGVFHSKPPALVPLKEMVPAVTVNEQYKPLLQVGAWVRVKSGTYKHDLAKVIEVNEQGNSATVKLVPRLDLHILAAQEAGKAVEKARLRPAQRPVLKDDLTALKLHVETPYSKFGDTYRVNNFEFLEGYLIKQVSARSLAIGNINPSFDEVQRFRSAARSSGVDAEEEEEDEMAKVAKSMKEGRDLNGGAGAPQASYKPGDTVLVVEGDLKNLVGTVHSIEDDGRLILKPKHDILTDLLDVQPGEIQKHFQAGDHVRVSAGQHEGETGMVVSVDEHSIATVFSDATKEEFKVFTKDVVDCAEITHGITTLGTYEIHDLVALDQTTFGIIVNVEKETCQVLTNRGTVDRPEVRVCRLPDLKRKILTRNATAPDRQMNTVAQDSIVTVQDGPLKLKKATVKHVQRGLLFCHCRDVIEHGSIVCVRARDCVVDGGASRAGGGGGLGGPARGGPSREPAYGGGRGGPRGARRDDSLIGISTTIIRGPYKGYVGKIVNATHNSVRIELEAQCKTVTVSKQYIKATQAGLGGLGMAPQPAYGAPFAQPGGYGAPMGADPYQPAPGSMTPFHAPGSKTPNPYGSMTPGPNATPFRESGSKTPFRESAWNPDNSAAAPTPLDPFTPADAFTPALTPQGSHLAGTPAMAPGGMHGAPTPMAADTPMVGATPAAGAPMAAQPPMGHQMAATPAYGATPAMTPHLPGAAPYGATPQMAGQYGATPAMTPGMMGAPPGMYAPTPQMGGQTPFAPTPLGMAGDAPQVPAPGPAAPAAEAEAPGGDRPIVAADLANPQVLKDLVVTLPDGRCGVVASIDVGSGSLACMLLMGMVEKDRAGQAVKFVHTKSSDGGFVQEMHPGRKVSLAGNVGRNTLVRIVADRGCVNEVARAHDGEDGTLIGFTEDDDEVIVRMVEDSMDIKVLAARFIALRVDSNAA